jgi:hypothetical protein
MRHAHKKGSQGSQKDLFYQYFGRFSSDDWKDQQGLLGEFTKLLQRQSGCKNKSVATGVGLSLLGHRLQDFLTCRSLSITIADTSPQLACSNLYQAALKMKEVLAKGHLPWGHKILHNSTLHAAKSILFTQDKASGSHDHTVIQMRPLASSRTWPKKGLLLINTKEWVPLSQIKSSDYLGFAKVLDLLLPNQALTFSRNTQHLLQRFKQAQKSFLKASGLKLEVEENLKIIALIHAVFADDRRLEVSASNLSWAISYLLTLYKQCLQN